MTHDRKRRAQKVKIVVIRSNVTLIAATPTLAYHLMVIATMVTMKVVTLTLAGETRKAERQIDVEESMTTER